MRVVVQLRGEVHMNHDVRDTLEMLHLGQVNHATFVPEEPTYDGMVTKVHDHVAHGTPSQETVTMLLERRGKTPDGDDLTEEWLSEETEYDSIEDLAEALLAEETTLKEAGLNPTLRLHPPRGGHKGIKQPVATGGQLGVHETDQIDELLEAMR